MQVFLFYSFIGVHFTTFMYVFIGGTKRQATQQPKQQTAAPAIHGNSPEIIPTPLVSTGRASSQGMTTRRVSNQTSSNSQGNQHVPSLPLLPEIKRSRIESPLEENIPTGEDQLKDSPAQEEAATMSSSTSSKLKLLTDRQEKIVIKHLSKMEDVLRSNTRACQLLAKLKLRQRYRQYNVPLFDVDAIVREMLLKTKGYEADPEDDTSLIPLKYTEEEMQQVVEEQHMKEEVTADPTSCTYFRNMPLDYIGRSLVLSSLLPPSHFDFQSKTVRCKFRMETFVSPYTRRILKPIIWRDIEIQPRRVKLLKDIRNHYAVTHTRSPPPENSTNDGIVYCYLREHHVPSVNALIASFFWSGVNIAECLEYPDYTVVALYKKLVVGCSFLTPDVKINEAYISFLLVHPDWQGCGIGSFMVYHLTQTCMGKDIVLHVSVDNHPAILLYQKFGFKMEKLCLDFYERYYPPSFHYSKHACFMRLKR
jgi:ribosomal protein S18 acetylase RimI-like enzyme